jgi:D-threonate/D-erythronate kinase
MWAETNAAVIADDLSGAAEMGGTAHCHGIQAEIQIDRPLPSLARLSVIDTDTRCLRAREAATIMESTAVGLLGLRPAGCLFKKVDSLLRGNVIAELTALLEAAGARRILLAPANPALGRTIQDGVYLVGGVPIDRTEFARDPRHPVSTSRVLDMLAPGPDSPPIFLVRPGQPLPSSGIIVAEASTAGDLAHWAQRTSGDLVWAGAAAFFSALLRAEGRSGQDSPAPLQAPRKTLLVSGSASEVSRAHRDSLAQAGTPVFSMPARGGDSHGNWIRSWALEISGAMERCAQVAVAIGQDLRPGEGGRLARHLSEVVEAVLKQSPVEHVWIEGGETASRLVRHLGWQRLAVLRQILPGVVELKPEPAGPLLTVKPGSYPWPR